MGIIFSPVIAEQSVHASSVRVETESADLIYLSQLNVTLTSEVIGKSIECVVDDGTSEIIVGSLNITEGMYTYMFGQLAIYLKVI